MRLCIFAYPENVHTRRIVAGLSKRGHDIHVIAPERGDIPGATLEVFRIPGLGITHPYGRLRRKQTYLSRFFREFDVVSVFFLHRVGFDPEVIERGCLALWPWGSDLDPPPGGPQPSRHFQNRRRLVLQRAHAVGVCGAWFRQFTAKFAGLDPTRIDVVPLGVDMDLFSPAADRNKTEIRRENPVVGFFKGFGHAYGSEYLVEAMPSILKAVPECRFEMVGAGSMLEYCRQRSHELGVDQHITWRAPVPQDALPDILRRWSLTVIPSVTESFGVAALEASAVGLPVVASNVGGLRDTVPDNVTGVHVPPTDSAAIADAVVNLLEDPGRRAALGQAGRTFVGDTFTWDTCLDKWEVFLEDARRRADAGITMTGVHGGEIAGSLVGAP